MIFNSHANITHFGCELNLISKVRVFGTRKWPIDAGLRVVPHFSWGIVERAKPERAWKSLHARKPVGCRLFSRGVIFTRARVSLALLSLRKNGGLLVVYIDAFLAWCEPMWQTPKKKGEGAGEKRTFVPSLLGACFECFFISCTHL